MELGIHNLDCLDVDAMRSMPSSSVSYVITSPPYNLREGMEDKGGLRVGHGGSRWKVAPLRNGYNSHTDNMPYPEYVAWQRAVLAECWRLIDDAGAIFYNHKPRIVKGSLRTPLALIGDLPLRQIIIWNRGSGFNYSHSFWMPKHEWIVVIAKPNFRLRDKSASGVGDVWNFPFENGNPHPAPFPYALPKQILETVARIDKPILDPFCGSGTTGRAAVNFGYSFIGFDVSAEYCEMARENIKNGNMKSIRPASQPRSIGLFEKDGEAARTLE